jgi:uncharacterized protein with HEPN domain
MSDLTNVNFETMTAAEFENYLPDLMASSEGKLTEDPRLKTFLAAHPDAAGLVRDLESIAEAAKSLFEPAEDEEPSDAIWSNIASKLAEEPLK